MGKKDQRERDTLKNSNAERKNQFESLTPSLGPNQKKERKLKKKIIISKAR